MRATWLADAFRTAGLDVHELPGWITRETRPGFDPLGVVCHHTATSKAWQDGHVAALLRDGRSDLSGPLSQIGLERDGTIVLIAAGRCNHNGFGLWGNDSYGIEAYNDGIGEPWPQAQLDAYEIACRVLCEHHGWNPLTHVLGHRETDPGRKVDPVGINMPDFRREVAANTPQPQPPSEDDMLIVTCHGKPTRFLTGFTFSVVDGKTVENLKAKGVQVVAFEADDYEDLLSHVSRSFAR